MDTFSAFHGQIMGFKIRTEEDQLIVLIDSQNPWGISSGNDGSKRSKR